MGFERIVAAPETTIGENPGTGFVIYPFTSWSYGPRRDTRASRENTPDLTSPGSQQVSVEQAGGFDFETRLGVMNDFLSGCLLSAWSTPVNITAGTINSTTSGGVGGFTTTGNAFSGVAVGQWLRVGNLHASVNGIHLVTAKPDNNTISVASAGFTAQSGNGDETCKGTMVRRGGSGWAALEKTFTIEKQWRPGSLYATSAAYIVSSMNYVQSLRLSAVVGELLTGSIEFLGQAERAPQGATSAGTPANPAASEILGPVLGLPTLYEGTFAAPSNLRRAEVSLEWQNNHTADRDLGSGSFGIQSVTLGVPTVNANLRVNMRSQNVWAFLDKARSQTLTKLAWLYQDTLGNAMMITLPSVRLEDAPAPVEGNTGTRFSTVRCASQRVEDPADPHYLVQAQIDYFTA